MEEFLACTSIRAFIVLRKAVTEGLPQRYVMYQKVQTNFLRVTPERGFTTLCQRTFNADIEDLDTFSNDLVSLVGIAFESWAAVRRIYKAWQFQVPRPKAPVDICRESDRLGARALPEARCHKELIFFVGIGFFHEASFLHDCVARSEMQIRQ